jgi:hypothetical protein
MSAGDDLRRIADTIDTAALDAGRYYVLGRKTGTAQSPRAPVRKHFTRGNAGRYNYEPLSEKYAAWKKKQVGNKPILVFSGTLRDTSGNATVEWREPYVVITWRNIPEYGAYHHTGGGNLPRRSPYEPNEQDVANIVMQFEMSMNRIISKADGRGGR